MLATKLRTMRNRSPRPEKSTWLSGIAFIKDLLDIVIKFSVILLPLPAFAIFLYLKTLQRTDLFLPAILSGPGLIALLEATFILCAVLLANFVAPSWVASQIANTYGKDGRPMLGTATFVILTGFIAGPCFLTLCCLPSAALQLWLKWVAGIAVAFLFPLLLFLLAWLSPRYIRMLTDAERMNRTLRARQSAKRTLWACASALISISTFVTFASLFRLYGLPSDGWLPWLAGALVFPASLLPGVMYVARRSWGDSRTVAFAISALMVGATILLLTLNGISLEPLALLAMRAMSIAEKETRTFELVSTSERPAWTAVGFRFIGDTSFFKASIRFQLGDVRLLCVDPYDVGGPYPGALGPFSAKLAKSPLPQTGCMTPLKDEVRVVEAPATGFIVSKDSVS
jgi:MFS family permease